MNWLKDSIKICFISCIIFFACTRGSDEINKIVRPQNQEFVTTVADTFTVKTATILFDSSLANSSSRMLIGSYYNADFGKITTNAYLQFLPQFYKNTLGPNPKYDSLYLELYFSNSNKSPLKTAYTYGPNTALQTFLVRRVDEDISNSLLYYNNKTFLTSAALGGFQLNTNSLLFKTIPGATLTYIKVPLSDDFGQELIAASGTFLFGSQANFLAKFKGLQIESLAGNSCIWGIDSASIKLKYHNYYAANNLKVDEEYSFIANNIRSQVRNLIADRSGTPLASLLENYNEISGTDCYVHASSGICTKISFPHLLDFKKQIGAERLVINRAELEITPDVSTIGAYPPPQNLYFYEFNADGKSIRNESKLPAIKTASSEGENSAVSPYMLSYNASSNRYIVKKLESDKNNQLILESPSITQFIQSIFDGNTNPNESLVLTSDVMVFFRPIIVDRTQVYLAEAYSEINQLKFKSNKEGIKLRIYYTPYP